MKKKILIIIIVVILLSLTVVLTQALYTSSSKMDYRLNSKGFYFETNYDKKINVYNFWDGSEIEYTVTNSLLDKFTEDDIKYEVKCVTSKNVVCKVNGSNDIYKSTLKGKKVSEEKIYLDIESSNKDIEVEVITKTTSPYKKTIKNKVLLHKDENIVGKFDYKLINYDNYSLLNISNYYNQDKCFNVKWNNNSLKVSVSEVEVIGTDTNGYVNEFKVDISKNDTKSIKFYNESDTLYDEKIFEISECSLES